MGIDQDVPTSETADAAPAARPKGNIQDEFLNDLRGTQPLVKVLMTCGRELTGYVKAFDSFTVLLQCANANVLLYKSGIAALGPVAESAPPHAHQP